MLKPVESVQCLIGNTPMVKLGKISREIPANIWVKLEFYNPSGSVKDRIALRMLEEAEKRGQITKGSVIVEPTSGNTGIGLALVCALKGYQMIAVMPEAMSKERKLLLEYLGVGAQVFRSLRIRKMRYSNHEKGSMAYELTDKGVEFTKQEIKL